MFLIVSLWEKDMTDQALAEMIQELKAWSREPFETSPDEPACLNELSTLVIRRIYDQQHQPLDRLRSELTPIAARLRRHLEAVPRQHRKAAEISAWTSVINGILFILEYDDPQQAASLISNGQTILRILTEPGRDEARIGTIRDNWPDGDPPSAASISRALGTLEEAGFLQRFGTTKGRKIRLLPKAGYWREMMERAEQTRPKDRDGAAGNGFVMKKAQEKAAPPTPRKVENIVNFRGELQGELKVA